MWELAHGDHIRAGLHELFDFESYASEIDFEVFKDVSADAGALFDQSEQDMFGADVFVVEPLGFLVRQGHNFSSAVCKSFKHEVPFSSGRWVYVVGFYAAQLGCDGFSELKRPYGRAAYIGTLQDRCRTIGLGRLLNVVSDRARQVHESRDAGMAGLGRFLPHD